MKSIGMTVFFLAVALAARADELEPAVNTSNVTPEQPAPPPPAAAPAAPKTSAPKTSAPKASAPAVSSTAPPKRTAGQKSTARDEIELDPTQITGNRELPNVMYVVPWKRPDIGDLNGRPPKSLLNEVLAPVDRDVFRRQNRYFTALQSQTAAAAAPPNVTPASNATSTLPGKDEK
jgi:hypothetical protein